MLTEPEAAVLDKDYRSLFLTWLEEHSASVMKVARAYALTEEDRQDLAQEILCQAWRSLPRFQGQSTPATWFYRVALHTALNWRRKESPRRALQHPLLEVHAVAADDCDSAELAQRRDMIERLYATIRRLPEADAALVLLYLEDLSYREIAEVLGISENNVAVKLSRTKKILAGLMKGAPHGN